MTPARLNHLIEHCLRLHRIDNREAHIANIARFLGVTPLTVRRWLRGERPIPRHVAVIMTMLHHWPEIRAGVVDNLILQPDEGDVRGNKGLGRRKKH